MKRLTWYAVALAAAMMVGLVTAEAAQAAKREGGRAKRAAREGKGERSSLRGEYAILASECDLTAEQEAELKTRVQARKQAMAEWQQAHADEAANLKQAVRAARDAGNKGEAKRLTQRVKALSAERQQLDELTMAQIYAVLTPEQMTTWAGFRLYRRAMRWCKRAGLTEEQQAAIRKMADAAAKRLARAGGKPGEDPVLTALRQEIERTVLTAEQREALGRKPTKERPEKKPAKEKAAK